MRWQAILAEQCAVAVPHLFGAMPPVRDGRQEPSTAELVARARSYVTQYQAALAYVIAEEEYVQIVLDGAAQEQQRRTLRGELLLAFLDRDKEWVAVHDFATMGRKPVAERTDLQQLLSQGAALSVIHQVAAQNARFNIGTIHR